MGWSEKKFCIQTAPSESKYQQKEFTEQDVRKETQDYIEALNEAINEDRAIHGKKPLKFEKDEVKEG